MSVDRGSITNMEEQCRSRSIYRSRIEEYISMIEECRSRIEECISRIEDSRKDRIFVYNGVPYAFAHA